MTPIPSDLMSKIEAYKNRPEVLAGLSEKRKELERLSSQLFSASDLATERKNKLDRLRKKIEDNRIANILRKKFSY